MPDDSFALMADSLISPSAVCFPVEPADTTDLMTVTKAIYVGTGGDIVLRSVRGSQDVTFRNVASGSILDVRVSAVRLTGTSATDLVGLA